MLGSVRRFWKSVNFVVEFRRMNEMVVDDAVSQKTQNICITFIQRRPNVFDVGPTLYKVIQMFSADWGSILTSDIERGLTWATSMCGEYGEWLCSFNPLTAKLFN